MKIFVTKRYELDCDAEDYKYLKEFVEEGDISAVDEMVDDADIFIEFGELNEEIQ